MRVIAGAVRGYRLRVPKTPGVRPTQDRIRESLFMILGFPLTSAGVLDLFAGSGALGIEALSRGAGSATFVDSNPVCLETIRCNLEHCGFLDRAIVLRGDIPRDYARISRAMARQVDLVLLDPPYRLKSLAPVLTGLLRCSLLRESARIVLECSSREPVYGIPEPFVLQERRVYGDTALTFFVYQKGAARADETRGKE